MASEGTINWPGKSGAEYKYWIYPIDTTHRKIAGNYVFAEKMRSGKFRAIYIGETGDMSERFDNHHKMPCITKQGATHITTHGNSGTPKAALGGGV